MDVYKVATEGFKKVADMRAGKLKGLKEVAALAVAAAAFATGIEREDLSLWKVVAIWCVGYLAHRLGSLLDRGLFDQLYGAHCKRATAKEMEEERTSRSPLPLRVQRAYHAFIDLLPGAQMLMYESRVAAAKQLGAGDRTEGLHATAEKLFSHTEAWDDEVKPGMVWSKAARTVAVLLLGLAVYGSLYHSHDFPAYTPGWRDFVVKLFVWWPLPLVFSVLALLVYLALRVLHMNALYALVSKSNVRRFDCADRTPGAEAGAVVEMIAVGHVVSPVNELPLLKPAAQNSAAVLSLEDRMRV